jgi:hypothetical protein
MPRDSLTLLQQLTARPAWRRAFLTICLAVTAVHAYSVAFVRPARWDDFDVHREVGRRFLSGDYLYANGLCYPYMPMGAMYFSPLALMDRSIGLAVRYMVAIACLVLTLSLLHRMVRVQVESLRPYGLTLGAVAGLLALRYLINDLDDGGPHLILLALLTGGIFAVWRGREVLGAGCFGLSIALKVSPALFVPFFLWKRQWRLAGYTVVAAVCWIVLPVVWMGPGSWWKHQVEWTEVAAGSFVGRQTLYSTTNEQQVRNSALSPALSRYLVTYPAEHPLRRNDPGYIPILNLEPQTAKGIVAVAVLGLLGMLAWSAGRSYQGPGDPAWVRECAGVLILAMLLSPVAWVQHLVWLIPALYVILADMRAQGGVSWPAWVMLGGYVIITQVLNYEFLGKRMGEAVLSYRPFTIGMLLVFGLLMIRARDAAGMWSPAGRLRASAPQSRSEEVARL